MEVQNQMKNSLRRAITVTAVAATALSLASLPALASTKKAGNPDPYFTWDTQLKQSATIAGAGSSFAAPLQNAAQAEYQSRDSNATISAYQAVGSGTGETDIVKKLVDWGGSDVPMAQSDINSKEPAGANYSVSQFLQVPIGLGGVGIAYNVPGLSSKVKLNLTAAVLASIYEGKITTWNNSAIEALNKGVKLPDKKIVVVARGDSSGTTYIFTNFLNAAAPSVWTTAPSKSPLVLPSGGLNPQLNGGVANDIASTPGAIGYVEYSYILLNGKLASGTANILNKSGKYVAPSTKSIATAAAADPNVSSTAFSIVNEPGAGAYPIVGYTWAIIWKVSQINDNEGTLLVKYLDWLSHSGTGGAIGGQNIAAEQGYVPLPANIQALATKTLLQCTGGANHAVLLQKSAS